MPRRCPQSLPPSVRVATATTTTATATAKLTSGALGSRREARLVVVSLHQTQPSSTAVKTVVATFGRFCCPALQPTSLPPPVAHPRCCFWELPASTEVRKTRQQLLPVTVTKTKTTVNLLVTAPSPVDFSLAVLLQAHPVMFAAAATATPVPVFFPHLLHLC